MKNNKRGFTIVELLAAIVILGIIMAVAIPAVSRILDRSHEDFYDSLEKQILLAAENYYVDHRGLLPQAIGQQRQVTIQTLIENKYLASGSVVDHSDQECDVNSSHVTVTKSGDDDFIYTLYLKCPARTIDQEETASNSLDVNVDISWRENNIDASKANIEINVDDSISKIASYQFYIYQDGQLAYTSESISANGVDYIERSVDLGRYVPASIRVVVTAYDIFGNYKTANDSANIADNSVPGCGRQTPGVNTWSNSGSREISIRCDSSSVDCLRNTFSRTFTEDAETGVIEIQGANGKTRTCEVDVMLDSTPPVCGTVSNSSTTWKSPSTNFSVGCTDATSGCTKNSFSKSYSNATSSVTTDTITIKDNAGNTNSCSFNAYIDADKPTCNYNVGNSSTTWTKSNRTVSVGCTDNQSGCTESTSSKTISTTTKTTTITIEDNVGNTNTCTVNAYVDKTAPSAPTKGSVKYSGGKVSVSGVSGSSDSHSGVSHYLYVFNTNGKAPTNGNSSFSTSTSTSATCGKTYHAYAIAVDKVGNKSSVYKIGSVSTGSCCKNYYWGNYGTCWTFGVKVMGGNWNNGKLKVCTGNGTGCVAATEDRCGRLGDDSYTYFQYCP